MLYRCVQLLSIVGVLVLGNAQAADFNARDFFSAPAGTSAAIVYLPVTRANEFRGANGSDKHADLSVNALVYRQIWFSDLCGTLCTPQFVVPYVDIDARLPGANGSAHERGIGDPQIGGTLFFINDPQSRTYSGLLTMLSVPVGEYHGRNPDVSPGTNRWGLTFNYNYTQGVGEKWVLEANLEAQLYGKNDDYYGVDFEQKPLYRLQAFASYDFTPATYGALRLIHADGGELKINGNAIDDTHQRYTQVGFEVGHWLDRSNQVLLGLTRNVASDNAFVQNNLLLRFVHVF
ncbi:transporter [Pseudomonas entomophila]|uniref:transporter n=1 Tax=Pseudomonas entomophila TaxID=312306 RepID=UPI0023D85B25|nr:transporter [Pseudomonas entomophila]MDF0731381.1 transporter [Pseudomonas entomophila]